MSVFETHAIAQRHDTRAECFHCGQALHENVYVEWRGWGEKALTIDLHAQCALTLAAHLSSDGLSAQRQVK